ncbi:Anthocyanin 3'-O-beta-glucosyltransferase [Hordeum vulgare]|nr:Anthocyanin 3'-O-beta-glucosyltransferase [Hordeum vulgare]
MLEDKKSARRDDNLENSLKIHHLTEEKRNFDANYDKLVEDVNQLLNLAQAQGGVIRTQKANHLKEKDKLNDEILVLNLHIDGLKKGIENLIKRRDELKIQIVDQLKALEKNQEKLKMTRDILDG